MTATSFAIRVAIEEEEKRLHSAMQAAQHHADMLRASQSSIESAIMNLKKLREELARENTKGAP